MSESKLVLTFIPALVAVLLNAEMRKGSPLTEQEVLEIRDQAAVVALTAEAVRELIETRGYEDIDPDHCWEQWQKARKDLTDPTAA